MPPSHEETFPDLHSLLQHQLSVSKLASSGCCLPRRFVSSEPEHNGGYRFCTRAIEGKRSPTSRSGSWPSMAGCADCLAASLELERRLAALSPRLLVRFPFAGGAPAC